MLKNLIMLSCSACSQGDLTVPGGSCLVELQHHRRFEMLCKGLLISVVVTSLWCVPISWNPLYDVKDPFYYIIDNVSYSKYSENTESQAPFFPPKWNKIFPTKCYIQENYLKT